MLNMQMHVHAYTTTCSVMSRVQSIVMGTVSAERAVLPECWKEGWKGQGVIWL